MVVEDMVVDLSPIAILKFRRNFILGLLKKILNLTIIMLTMMVVLKMIMVMVVLMIL
jgi:hypothetical protein